MAALLNQPPDRRAASARRGLAAVRHAAHARLLEERPTSTAGEPYPVRLALQALEGGQVVNCAAGPVVHSVEESAGDSAFLARLGLRPRRRVERWGGEVLDVQMEVGRLLVGLPHLPPGVEVGHPAAVDFTDVTGTYHILGRVEALREASRGACLVVACRRATRVQMRRFVRVPVRIVPQAMEMRVAPGEWRTLTGHVIDLSLGGLGLLVSEPLPADTLVRVTLDLPGRCGPLAVRGRVVEPPGPAEARASAPTGSRAPAVYRRGLELEPLAVDDLRQLQRALYRRQVELRRLGDSLPDRRSAVEIEPAEPLDAPPSSGWKFWRR